MYFGSDQSLAGEQPAIASETSAATNMYKILRALIIFPEYRSGVKTSDGCLILREESLRLCAQLFSSFKHGPGHS